MSRHLGKVIVGGAAVMALAACGGPSDVPEPGAAAGPSVTVDAPAEGAAVARRFDLGFAVSGLTLAPAGAVTPGTGHLHALVDTPCLKAGEVIPKDAAHVHLGKGQATTQLELSAGPHTLCVQAADGVHKALDVSTVRKVVVDPALRWVTLGVPAGDKVPSPVAVTMSAENLKIVPAGDLSSGTGHFHIVVDAPCIGAGLPVPKDATHLHYGTGQTSASLELTPGEHTLCLQAGDGAHLALPVTHTVTVNVA